MNVNEDYYMSLWIAWFWLVDSKWLLKAM